MAQTIHRICPLCEATCGLSIQVQDGQVVDLRGDTEDPFSRGYLCPKAYGLKELSEDPDRLRKPLRRRPDGSFEEIGWDEAFAYAVEKLSAIRKQHGAESIATYSGNPNAHSLHAMVYGPVLLRALGTHNRYSASSADQLPKMLSSQAMFGGGLTVPVPDLDRTDYLLVIGANPRVSNGSLMTAPDVGHRLDAIVDRGGKVVVIDPRRTETAAHASEHIAIRPGGDAAWLLSLMHVMFEESLVDLGNAVDHVVHVKRLEEAVQPFTPERVEVLTGVPSHVTQRIAEELAASSSAACYGRIGTTCQEFGTLASWAVDALNLVTGNLDREGGVMFTLPAANRGGNRPDRAGVGKGARPASRRSRVRGLPYLFGEFPVATLADEILTEGDGQVRAVITIAGNPLVSAPGVDQLERAFASLDFLLSVDFYLNETTRHAHLILPPPSPLERDTYDLALYQLAVRNVAKYSPPALPRPADQPDEWEILATLAKGMLGMANMDLKAADDFLLRQLVQEEVADGGRWPGLTVDEAIAALGPEPGPRRVLDLLLRTGPYGDGFGREPDGLSLAKLEAHPHGIDLGALKPRLPSVLRMPEGKIDAAPEMIMQDLPRLEAALDRVPPELVLIGRRHLRSNNSWMHNVHALIKGKPRCTLLVHPEDAKRLGLQDGAQAAVRSEAGEVLAPVELSEQMRPGVVSLPHGWGHDRPGMRMKLAEAHAGSNVNLVSDPGFLDEPSGNAAFNGVPVQVVPA